MDTPSRGQIMDLDMSPSGPASPVSNLNVGKYRRNGKLQSCEPCRRSKLRCDHAVPTCGRCIRRRCQDQCVYHPNPLSQPKTRLRSRPTLPPLPTPSTGSQESPHPILDSIEAPYEEVSDQDTQPLVISAPVPLLPPHRAASAPPAPPTHVRRDSNLRKDPGFLGQTSYATIFAEGSLEGVETFCLDLDLEASHAQHNVITLDRIAQGCKILSFLQNRSLVHELACHFFHINGGEGMICPERVLVAWLDGLWASHDTVLRTQNPERIRQLSELIWRNTQLQLPVNGNTSYMEWINSATGPHIRWEVIGIFAAFCGLCATTLDPSAELLRKHKVDRHTLASQMNDVAANCLAFCRDCEILDDTFIWLLGEKIGLSLWLKGHGSYSMYQEIGEMGTAVMTMGLHRGIKAGKKTPFFLAQWRKAAMNNAYTSEIGICTFLGRPPRLSSRYCTLEPPLGLTLDQQFTEAKDLDAMLASLDKDGFNKEFQVTRAFFLRVWHDLGILREDILDLAIGNFSREEVIQRVADLQKKIEKGWAELPDGVKQWRDRHQQKDKGKKDMVVAMYTDFIVQSTRASEIVLQRVLIRKTGASPEKLIRLAREVLVDVLRFTTLPEHVSHFQVDVISYLVSHGLRSAAIIAIELLKQEQLPVYPKNPLLPRSRTIQELSVFAARLGEVDPTSGGYNLCEQGRKVITRILDKILSPPNQEERPKVPRQRNGDQGQQISQTNLDLLTGEALQEAGLGLPVSTNSWGENFDFEGPMFGTDKNFMQWLETMDFSQAEPWDGDY